MPHKSYKKMSYLARFEPASSGPGEIAYQTPRTWLGTAVVDRKKEPTPAEPIEVASKRGVARVGNPRDGRIANPPHNLSAPFGLERASFPFTSV